MSLKFAYVYVLAYLFMCVCVCEYLGHECTLTCSELLQVNCNFVLCAHYISFNFLFSNSFVVFITCSFIKHFLTY